MKTLDAGHRFAVPVLDGFDGEHHVVTYVKREGRKYPGNVGTHAGITTQGALRSAVARLQYVNNQDPCEETAAARSLVIEAILLLENRAARIHGRPLMDAMSALYGVCCAQCGHVGCDGACRAGKVTVTLVHDCYVNKMTASGECYVGICNTCGFTSDLAGKRAYVEAALHNHTHAPVEIEKEAV